MRTFPDLIQLGSNRGARRFEDSFQHPVGQVTTVDPTPGRAAALAETYRQRGATTRVIEARCEDVLDRLDDGAHAILAVDDARSIASVIAKRKGPTHLQVVASGEPSGQSKHPGLPFGISAGIHEARPKERAELQLMFDQLAEFVPRQSSQVLRQSGPAAMRLRTVRDQTALASSKRVLRYREFEHDDELSYLFMPEERLPLQVLRSTGSSMQEHRVQALDESRHSRAGVVVVARDRVDIFIIEKAARRSGGFIKAHFLFLRPKPLLPAPVRRQVVRVIPRLNEARFAPTQRLRRRHNVGSVAASVFVAALTD